MNHPCKTASLIAFAALLSAGPAFTQTSSTEPTPEAKAAAPVAYVYVQTVKGVNLYDAAADGKLTLVKGSPFQTIGELIGSNGKYLITLGTYDVHSYAVESDGAVGKQVSAVDTQDYAGGQCGIDDPIGGPSGTAGAVLDHTGQNLYVSLADADCSSYITFKIAKDTGKLVFNGDTLGGADPAWYGAPTITANDKFAYLPGSRTGQFSAFSRESDGTLASISVNETDPDYFEPALAAADATNHLATWGTGIYVEPQFVSYTVGDGGNVVSTNPAKNMPLPGGVYPTSLSMSPSGKILAVGGAYFEDEPQGLFVMRFNGAEPITPYSGVLTSDGIWSVRWDSNNHLYAIGHDLHVYTITPTTIKEAPGSPYTLSSFECGISYGLVVVPRL
jgi:hypothetical protein